MHKPDSIKQFDLISDNIHNFTESNFLFLKFKHGGSVFIADTEFVILCIKPLPDFIT